MNVLVNDVFKREGLEDKIGFKYVDQDELLASCDIISLHTPSTPKTKGMVNAEFLGKMKSEGVLINTSRANVVNEDALLAHLEVNENFWVGSDVFVGEPSAK